MKKVILACLPLIDIVLALFTWPSAWILKKIRSAGIDKLPYCKKVLLKIGVFPIRNHYYEPRFDLRGINHPFSMPRKLTGISWNLDGQLVLLEKLQFADELQNTPLKKTGTMEFHLNNERFESGDAEFWYQIIRFFKPERIFEIGSGYSTLMARRAILKNQEENNKYNCKHVCIEPYEMPWLEEANVTLYRKKVEEMETGFFSELQENDILFIDSSHIIRPEGDVLYIYLELLPCLKKGVVVHVHDIFTPRNYLEKWIMKDILFWNEQYLLEAFLSSNADWKIIAALNLLHHDYYDRLKNICPFLTVDREPGSIYIQKIR